MQSGIKTFIEAVNGAISLKQIKNSDFDFLVRSAEKHGIMRLILSAADEEQKQRYKKEIECADMKYVLQSMEYDSVTSLLNEADVDFAALKGVRLKELYPQPFMREMADIDLLVRKKDLAKVRKIMTAEGYSFKHKGHHDVYKNSDGIVFEIHETLLDAHRKTGADEYFKDVWKRAKKSEHGFILSPDDEYIYLMAHLYGHFHRGGAGVRLVLDIYLFAEKYKNELNYEYINKVFGECGLREFSKKIMRLAEVWFKDAESDAVTQELAQYIFTCGLYGRVDNLSLDLYDMTRSRGANALNAFKHKLFLNRCEIARRYPEVPSRFPLAYVKRIAELVGEHGGGSLRWAKAFLSADKSAAAEHKSKMKRFGVEG